MRRFFFLPLAILIPIVAHAGPGWGWNELESREWRDATLDWAQDIDPQHLDTAYLAEMVEPPPREMWCVEGADVTDSQESCQIYFDLLDMWIADYLELGVNEPIPANALTFPTECPSACFVE